MRLNGDVEVVGCLDDVSYCGEDYVVDHSQDDEVVDYSCDHRVDVLIGGDVTMRLIAAFRHLNPDLH